MRRLTYTVTKEYDQAELSIILADVLCLSGYLIRRNKHYADAVTVNGIHADVRTIVHKGDLVSVLLSDPEKKSEILPQEGSLDIVFEDDDLIILNKRAEDIVHPDHSHQNNTLGNYLMYYYNHIDCCADFHPVHRLDNGTSGLIIVAKHSYAQNILTKQMHTDSFVRKYLAICSGIISEDEGTINLPISRINQQSIKRYVDDNGQNAITKYRVIERLGDSTLVELTLLTGRTHQIRVHMSYLGHPLIGDRLYGGELTANIKRPALHSYECEFYHPITKDKMIISAKPSDDFMNQLRAEGYNAELSDSVIIG